ncbi:MAG TPA: hypothetical protein VMP01_24945 [Pirellulaceae bacterium]|nr:hypothetical protein [Pirellulaceae bacterium]
MNDNFIQLRVVYEDLPDLIQLGVLVRSGEWSAHCRAYAGPTAFADEAQRLLAWVSSPIVPMRIEAGADNGIGWMLLKFYTIDRAGHVRCAVSLATGREDSDARTESTWRFSIEMPTELGLVERFARECIALGSDYSREARLLGLPT